MENISDAISAVMDAYREELKTMFKGDTQFLAIMDHLFLIPVAEKNDEITNDFIDGFCVALLYTGKLENDLQVDRLKSIIRSARNLILIG